MITYGRLSICILTLQILARPIIHTGSDTTQLHNQCLNLQVDHFMSTILHTRSDLG